MRVIGTKIKAIREQRGMSTLDLAKAADLGERRIQQIEHGELANINLNIAKAIARKLGIKVESIAVGR